ncbi:uncharacterized protein LOC119674126 [Teleopsis dalmanni]|uniref:uncharacterized protein LOC119674126 n=1 Tax=Teleopsis dalmanni TaxID=139649 RepID=UPI0018CECA9F|nr:uncharacterized protein LOC119674126 [Teleopsis dalmanni]
MRENVLNVEELESSPELTASETEPPINQIHITETNNSVEEENLICSEDVPVVTSESTIICESNNAIESNELIPDTVVEVQCEQVELISSLTTTDNETCTAPASEENVLNVEELESSPELTASETEPSTNQIHITETNNSVEEENLICSEDVPAVTSEATIICESNELIPDTVPEVKSKKVELVSSSATTDNETCTAIASEEIVSNVEDLQNSPEHSVTESELQTNQIDIAETNNSVEEEKLICSEDVPVVTSEPTIICESNNAIESNELIPDTVVEVQCEQVELVSSLAITDNETCTPPAAEENVLNVEELESSPELNASETEPSTNQIHITETNNSVEQENLICSEDVPVVTSEPTIICESNELLTDTVVEVQCEEIGLVSSLATTDNETSIALATEENVSNVEDLQNSPELTASETEPPINQIDIGDANYSRDEENPICSEDVPVVTSEPTIICESNELVPDTVVEVQCEQVELVSSLATTDNETCTPPAFEENVLNVEELESSPELTASETEPSTNQIHITETNNSVEEENLICSEDVPVVTSEATILCEENNTIESNELVSDTVAEVLSEEVELISSLAITDNETCIAPPSEENISNVEEPQNLPELTASETKPSINQIDITQTNNSVEEENLICSEDVPAVTSEPTIICESNNAIESNELIPDTVVEVQCEEIELVSSEATTDNETCIAPASEENVSNAEDLQNSPELTASETEPPINQIDIGDANYSREEENLICSEDVPVVTSEPTIICESNNVTESNELVSDTVVEVQCEEIELVSSEATTDNETCIEPVSEENVSNVEEPQNLPELTASETKPSINQIDIAETNNLVEEENLICSEDAPVVTSDPTIICEENNTAELNELVSDTVVEVQCEEIELVSSEATTDNETCIEPVSEENVSNVEEPQNLPELTASETEPSTNQIHITKTNNSVEEENLICSEDVPVVTSEPTIICESNNAIESYELIPDTVVEVQCEQVVLISSSATTDNETCIEPVSKENVSNVEEPQNLPELTASETKPSINQIDIAETNNLVEEENLICSEDVPVVTSEPTIICESNNAIESYELIPDTVVEVQCEQVVLISSSATTDNETCIVPASDENVSNAEDLQNSPELTASETEPPINQIQITETNNLVEEENLICSEDVPAVTSEPTIICESNNAIESNELIPDTVVEVQCEEIELVSSEATTNNETCIVPASDENVSNAEDLQNSPELTASETEPPINQIQITETNNLVEEENLICSEDVPVVTSESTIICGSNNATESYELAPDSVVEVQCEQVELISSSATTDNETCVAPPSEENVSNAEDLQNSPELTASETEPPINQIHITDTNNSVEEENLICSGDVPVVTSEPTIICESNNAIESYELIPDTVVEVQCEQVELISSSATTDNETCIEPASEENVSNAEDLQNSPELTASEIEPPINQIHITDTNNSVEEENLICSEDVPVVTSEPTIICESNNAIESYELIPDTVVEVQCEQVVLISSSATTDNETCIEPVSKENVSNVEEPQNLPELTASETKPSINQIDIAETNNLVEEENLICSEDVPVVTSEPTIICESNNATESYELIPDTVVEVQCEQVVLISSLATTDNETCIAPPSEENVSNAEDLQNSPELTASETEPPINQIHITETNNSVEEENLICSGDVPVVTSEPTIICESNNAIESYELIPDTVVEVQCEQVVLISSSATTDNETCIEPVSKENVSNVEEPQNLPELTASETKPSINQIDIIETNNSVEEENLICSEDVPVVTSESTIICESSNAIKSYELIPDTVVEVQCEQVELISSSATTDNETCIEPVSKENVSNVEEPQNLPELTASETKPSINQIDIAETNNLVEEENLICSEDVPVVTSEPTIICESNNATESYELAPDSVVEVQCEQVELISSLATTDNETCIAPASEENVSNVEYLQNSPELTASETEPPINQIDIGDANYSREEENLICSEDVPVVTSEPTIICESNNAIESNELIPDTVVEVQCEQVELVSSLATTDNETCTPPASEENVLNVGELESSPELTASETEPSTNQIHITETNNSVEEENLICSEDVPVVTSEPTIICESNNATESYELIPDTVVEVQCEQVELISSSATTDNETCIEPVSKENVSNVEEPQNLPELTASETKPSINQIDIAETNNLVEEENLICSEDVPVVTSEPTIICESNNAIESYELAPDSVVEVQCEQVELISSLATTDNETCIAPASEENVSNVEDLQNSPELTASETEPPINQIDIGDANYSREEENLICSEDVPVVTSEPTIICESNNAIESNELIPDTVVEVQCEQVELVSSLATTDNETCTPPASEENVLNVEELESSPELTASETEPSTNQIHITETNNSVEEENLICSEDVPVVTSEPTIICESSELVTDTVVEVQCEQVELVSSLATTDNETCTPPAFEENVLNVEELESSPELTASETEPSTNQIHITETNNSVEEENLICSEDVLVVTSEATILCEENNTIESNELVSDTVVETQCEQVELVSSEATTDNNTCSVPASEENVLNVEEPQNLPELTASETKPSINQIDIAETNNLVEEENLICSEDAPVVTSDPTVICEENNTTELNELVSDTVVEVQCEEIKLVSSEATTDNETCIASASEENVSNVEEQQNLPELTASETKPSINQIDIAETNNLVEEENLICSENAPVVPSDPTVIYEENNTTELNELVSDTVVEVQCEEIELVSSEATTNNETCIVPASDENVSNAEDLQNSPELTASETEPPINQIQITETNNLVEEENLICSEDVPVVTSESTIICGSNNATESYELAPDSVVEVQCEQVELISSSATTDNETCVAPPSEENVSNAEDLQNSPELTASETEPPINQIHITDTNNSVEEENLICSGDVPVVTSEPTIICESNNAIESYELIPDTVVEVQCEQVELISSSATTDNETCIEPPSEENVSNAEDLQNSPELTVSETETPINQIYIGDANSSREEENLICSEDVPVVTSEPTIICESNNVTESNELVSDTVVEVQCEEIELVSSEATTDNETCIEPVSEENISNVEEPQNLPELTTSETKPSINEIDIAETNNLVEEENLICSEDAPVVTSDPTIICESNNVTESNELVSDTVVEVQCEEIELVSSEATTNNETCIAPASEENVSNAEELQNSPELTASETEPPINQIHITETNNSVEEENLICSEDVPVVTSEPTIICESDELVTDTVVEVQCEQVELISSLAKTDNDTCIEPASEENVLNVKELQNSPELTASEIEPPINQIHITETNNSVEEENLICSEDVPVVTSEPTIISESNELVPDTVPEVQCEEIGLVSSLAATDNETFIEPVSKENVLNVEELESSPELTVSETEPSIYQIQITETNNSVEEENLICSEDVPVVTSEPTIICESNNTKESNELVSDTVVEVQCEQVELVSSLVTTDNETCIALASEENVSNAEDLQNSPELTASETEPPINQFHITERNNSVEEENFFCSEDVPVVTSEPTIICESNELVPDTVPEVQCEKIELVSSLAATDNETCIEPVSEENVLNVEDLQDPPELTVSETEPSINQIQITETNNSVEEENLICSEDVPVVTFEATIICEENNTIESNELVSDTVVEVLSEEVELVSSLPTTDNETCTPPASEENVSNIEEPQNSPELIASETELSINQIDIAETNNSVEEENLICSEDVPVVTSEPTIICKENNTIESNELVSDTVVEVQCEEIELLSSFPTTDNEICIAPAPKENVSNAEDLQNSSDLTASETKPSINEIDVAASNDSVEKENLIFSEDIPIVTPESTIICESNELVTDTVVEVQCEQVDLVSSLATTDNETCIAIASQENISFVKELQNSPELNLEPQLLQIAEMLTSSGHYTSKSSE